MFKNELILSVTTPIINMRWCVCMSGKKDEERRLDWITENGFILLYFYHLRNPFVISGVFILRTRSTNYFPVDFQRS
jgi:hypothetical protein